MAENPESLTPPADAAPASAVPAPAQAAATPTDAPSAADEYRVNLDIYSGPLELLLYLIRRDEVDIKDIPIARITGQYLQYVEVIRRIDINLAGEFLVMAATLMEIKSRMLIPKQPADPNAPEGQGASSVEELTDPRYELVKQLLEYKHFKDAASDLKRRAETEKSRFGRGLGKPSGAAAPLDIEDLDLFRLIDAFNAIMSSIGHSAYGHEVTYDDTPISLHQADILDRLVRETSKTLTLHAMFAGRTKKTEMIGLFLATLELIRQKKVTVQQDEILGEITIALREGSDDQILFAQGGTDDQAVPVRAAGAAAAESPPAAVTEPDPAHDAAAPDPTVPETPSTDASTAESAFVSEESDESDET